MIIEEGHLSSVNTFLTFIFFRFLEARVAQLFVVSDLFFYLLTTLKRSYKKQICCKKLVLIDIVLQRMAKYFFHKYCDLYVSEKCICNQVLAM